MDCTSAKIAAGLTGTKNMRGKEFEDFRQSHSCTQIYLIILRREKAAAWMHLYCEWAEVWGLCQGRITLRQCVRRGGRKRICLINGSEAVSEYFC